MVKELKPGIQAALSGGGVAHTLAAPNSGGSAPRQASFFADPEPIEDAPTQAVDSRGAGRPAGATNKRTGKMAEWLLALGFKHPGRFLAEIVHQEPDELAKKLGCEPIEALDVQRKAAAELLPYFESKMPTSLELPDGVVPVINIGALDVTPRGAGRAGMAIDDIEQDQGLSDAVAVRPDDAKSHESDKALNDMDNPR